MRILLVHNFYGSTAPSGENKVFESERMLLVKHGHTVEAYVRHSDEIRSVVGARKVWGLLKGAACTVANPFAAQALGEKIREFKPDVVHFHNTFPLISPLAIRTAKKCGAKVMMTLHNYRVVCAAGVPTRCGKVCSECFFNRLSVWPALKHRCYRGSLLATIPLAVNIWFYRSRWMKWVDRFIVLSEFQRERMIECGFLPEKIVVKGNFVNEFELKVGTRERKNQVVYVGRLSDEKGVRALIKAWKLFSNNNQRLAAGHALVIIGDGDQRVEYEKLAEGHSIQFLGQKTHDEVLKTMAAAKAIVMPSVCWETFGLVVVEAMFLGTPCIVSDMGALPFVAGPHGYIVKHDSPEYLEKLAAAIAVILGADDATWLRYSQKAKVRSRMFTAEENYKMLMSIYGA